MPVEQPRRKREPPVANRRMNALKHQHTHPAAANPAIFKDAFGSAKIGEFLEAYGENLLRQSFVRKAICALYCFSDVFK